MLVLHVCCMCVACVLHVCCMCVACALHWQAHTNHTREVGSRKQRAGARVVGGRARLWKLSALDITLWWWPVASTFVGLSHII